VEAYRKSRESGFPWVIVTKSELRKIKGHRKIKFKQAFISKKNPTGMEICENTAYHLPIKLDTKN